MTRFDVDLTIVGQAGQGLQTISRTLGRLLVRGGFHVFVSQDVMSRIRGGHNFSRLRISDRSVGCDKDKTDVLISLDPALVKHHVARLSDDAVVVVDTAAADLPDGLKVLKLPLLDLAREHGKDPITVNSVAVGAALALVGFEPPQLADVFDLQFGRKGKDVVERNVAAARAGFAAVPAELKKACPHCLPVCETCDDRVLISGAEAIALGAMAAGVKFVTGYPMSPGTPILEYCARRAEEAGLVVEQTEDEVSAINMALGAAFAGAPALVCTAGGGFALMCEGLSLAGMTETPVLVCVGMRPGPATGMATRTAQADLLYAIYAGHGEFPRAVLAPGDAVQAFRAAAQGIGIAEKYQAPALLLFDQLLADSLWTVNRTDLWHEVNAATLRKPEPAGIEAYAYRRYEPVEDGVSPRLLPGTAGQIVYADSDEHSEEGHITETAAQRIQQVDKRNAKLTGIASELGVPATEPGADALVFCFGSTRATVTGAVERLRGKFPKLAIVHLESVWPFPAQAIAEAAKGVRRVVTVENNYTGQLAQLLTQECLLRVDGTVRRFDGRPFTVAEVAEGIEKIVKGE